VFGFKKMILNELILVKFELNVTWFMFGCIHINLSVKFVCKSSIVNLSVKILFRV